MSTSQSRSRLVPRRRFISLLVAAPVALAACGPQAASSPTAAPSKPADPKPAEAKPAEAKPVATMAPAQ